MWTVSKFFWGLQCRKQQIEHVVHFRNYLLKIQVLEYLGKSHGIQKTRELAIKHANLAAEAIESLPESDEEDVKRSRRALIDLTQRVITRTKWQKRLVHTPHHKRIVYDELVSIFLITIVSVRRGTIPPLFISIIHSFKYQKKKNFFFVP